MSRRISLYGVVAVRTRKIFHHKRGGYGADRTQMPVLALLFAGFLLGAVTGCFIGRGAEGSGGLTDYLTGHTDTGVSDFLRELVRSGQYHLIVLAAATSVAGVFVIPLVSAGRGYFLSCTAAALVASLPEHGAAAALIICGIPAVLTVPSLFLLELDGFALSARLRALSAGKSCLPVRNTLAHDLAVTVLSVILAALAQCLLIPFLLSCLI